MIILTENTNKENAVVENTVKENIIKEGIKYDLRAFAVPAR